MVRDSDLPLPDYRATPYEISSLITDAAFIVFPAISKRYTNFCAADTTHFAVYLASVRLLMTGDLDKGPPLMRN